MTTYCQAGEKAYLRIDGSSEVWEFDGPITVEVRLKQGETYYPNVWFWSFRAVVYGYDASTIEFYYHTINDVGEKYADMWIDCPVALTGEGTVIPGNYAFDPPRYAIGTPIGYGERSVNVLSINRQLQRVRPSFHSWVRKGARGWWASGGHNENPVPGQSAYELLVNGKVIKVSADPIEYSVKCGDRCPPGEKWDERCGACVCENMGGILADLRGATAIARQLRSKA